MSHHSLAVAYLKFLYELRRNRLTLSGGGSCIDRVDIIDLPAGRSSSIHPSNLLHRGGQGRKKGDEVEDNLGDGHLVGRRRHPSKNAAQRTRTLFLLLSHSKSILTIIYGLV